VLLVLAVVTGRLGTSWSLARHQWRRVTVVGVLNFGPLALVSIDQETPSSEASVRSQTLGSKMEIAAFVCFMVLLIALPAFFTVR
jgi:hypothetical protein